MQSGHLGIRFHVAQASLQARLFCYFRTAVEPTYGLQSTMTLLPLPVLTSCLGLCAAPRLAHCPTLYACLNILQAFCPSGNTMNLGTVSVGTIHPHMKIQQACKALISPSTKRSDVHHADII